MGGPPDPPIVPMGERWRRILRGETAQALGPRVGRRLFGLVPSAWRCKFCNAPFSGPLAPAFRVVGYSASRKNPNVCARCMETAPEGGAVVPVTILLADVRGFTSIAERAAPLQTTALMRRFYEAASGALLKHEALLATIAGDQVMALFLPGFAGAAHARRAVDGARDLLAALGYRRPADIWLDVGIGISTGEDYVGNVGGGGFKDFTSLGDTTNTAARLQAIARSGEVIVDGRTYALAADRCPGAERLLLQLKGKQQAVEAYRIASQLP